MKSHTLWITAIALCLSACSKQDPVEPQPPESDQTAAPAEEMQVTNSEFDEAFIAHMHKHAEHLDDLMFALADGNLERAGTSAYWLSQHESVEGIPEQWKNYVTSMRNAAYEVETADDLETAQAAAEDISVQCQACHAAAGVTALE